MCQGKHSDNAIDIPASCKVTEECFKMKPASMKIHNYLDTESRNTETKFFSVSRFCSGFGMGYIGVQMKARIKDSHLSKQNITHYKFQEINATSGHLLFNHYLLLW